MAQTILCILAGGRSRRFGASKLNVRIDGRPIAAWQADRLDRFAGRAAQRWLSVAPAATLPPGASSFQRWIVDGFVDAGPLHGLARVLGAAGDDDIVAIAPADMPMLSRFDLSRLLVALPRRGGVMARWDDGPRAGRVEPMPSIWRGGRQLVDVALARGTRAVHALADLPQVNCVPLKHAVSGGAYANINRRDDVEAIQELLGKTVDPGSGQAGAEA